MLRIISALLQLTFISIKIDSFSVNNSAELISTYAKVAHWGNSGSSKLSSEGRSSGQTLWTHRSDVNIRGGQNLKRKQPVTYYYSMRAPSSKVDQAKLELIPNKGEVVQERFNPRPYFDFVFDDSPRGSRRPDSPKSNVKQSNNFPNQPKPPSIVYGTPVDSFSGFDRPPALPKPDSKPPSDVYSSPFSSYNPPDIKPDAAKNNAPGSFDFPPNDAQIPSVSYGPPNGNKPLLSPPQAPAPPSPSYGAAIDTLGPPSDTYGAPAAPPPSPPSDSYGPPIAPPSDVYGPPDSKPKPPKKPDDMKAPNDDYSFHPPLAAPDDSMPPKQSDSSYFAPPPPQPPSNGDDFDQSYYGPSPPSSNGNGDNPYPPPDNSNPASDGGGMNNGNVDHHHPPSSDYGPPISQTVEPPGPVEPPYMVHPPTDHHDHQPPPAPSMADDALAPPPVGVPYGKIPQYLDHEPNDHDFYHFGHHDVYHEVHHTTTTTTEAPRAGHYSYYYLGRKLWYIPLYFSVYFIVYVTILILKSIARHKIQFSHHFDKGRSSRALDINSINQTVTDALENVEKRYM